MKTFIRFIVFSLLVGCTVNKTQSFDQQVKDEMVAGNFSRASEIIDSLILNHEMTDKVKRDLIFTKDSLRRVSLDFNRNRQDIINWIVDNQQFTPTDEQLNEWEEKKVLEYRVIDSEKRYFRNAAPNIFRVDPTAMKLIKTGVKSAESGAERILNSHLTELTPTDVEWRYLLPKVSTHVRYTLTVPKEEVVEGESVKAWLPYPRQDVSRQTEVVFLSASQQLYELSDDKTEHTSIYMVQIAKKDEPVVFSVEFSFTSQGEWFDLSKIKPQQYDINSELYKKYTSERGPHIQFSDRIKKLTDSITYGNKNAVEDLQSIYRYITTNYPWASAIEYSTIPNIPEYVLEYKKGDCGQVALLLITMLRYKGIPARWQSGWMMHPGEVNLHDWAEAYFEGVGWIPVDVSFGRGEALENEQGREFFMSGIDSYRFYVNSDYSGSFFPEKVYPRSENVDFQRGEVENESENYYFNRWRYKMEVMNQNTINPN